MSVTVKKAWTDCPFEWDQVQDSYHELLQSNTLHLVIEDDEGRRKTYSFCFKGRDGVSGAVGFRCNGLSVPRPFRWFLPSWDEGNGLYNLAGALHDWLYATNGAFGEWTREECDDIFRGILREAGISRFKAGVADKAVEIFAGCGRHWCNDDFHVSGLVCIDPASA